MTVFGSLMITITFGTLIVMILSFNHKENSSIGEPLRAKTEA